MMRAEMGVAELAEPLGFDSYWPPEHHSTDYSRAKATLAPSGGDRSRAWPRHLLTVWARTCSFRATTLLARPSPHSRISRARRANCGCVRERSASDSNASCSACVSSSGAFGRPAHVLSPLVEEPREPRDLFHSLQGQDTSISRDATPVRVTARADIFHPGHVSQQPHARKVGGHQPILRSLGGARVSVQGLWARPTIRILRGSAKRPTWSAPFGAASLPWARAARPDSRARRTRGQRRAAWSRSPRRLDLLGPIGQQLPRVRVLRPVARRGSRDSSFQARSKCGRRPSDSAQPPPPDCRPFPAGGRARRPNGNDL
jgi:hypothetical protein